jgi:hypothetical protein
MWFRAACARTACGRSAEDQTTCSVRADGYGPEDDARDIGEIAAIELVRREQAEGPLPSERINLVGPDTLTGAEAAAIWSDVLGRPIAYPGGDVVVFEQNLRQLMPSWMALDMRLMGERFVSDGMVPETGDVERLTALLGRPLRTYRDLVATIAG